MLKLLLAVLLLACILHTRALSLRPCMCTGQRKALICATNGKDTKLFKNECDFECSGYIQTDMSNCLKVVDPIRKCDFACLDVMQSVCGFNGTNYAVFSNSCYMELHNCQKGTNYVLVKPQYCNIKGSEPVPEVSSAVA